MASEHRVIRDSGVDLPSGADAWEVRSQLTEMADASQSSTVRRNLILDGPLLMSSAALPWADAARAIALDAFQMFIARSHYVGGGVATMEREIIEFIGTRLHLQEPYGVVTTGGTESNFLALMAAMEAKGKRGSVVVAKHAHISVWKACRVLGLDPVILPGDYGLFDEDALRSAIRPDTVGIVATAGSIPLGVVDPIEMIGAVALDFDVFLHIDASVGGWLFPFAPERFSARRIPSWDFAVPGVRSVSACPHKHGWAPVGAGVLLYRENDDYQRMREFAPTAGTLTGIRSGGPTAATWALIKCLGDRGYAATTNLVLDLAEDLDRALSEVDGVSVDPRSVVNIRHLLFDNFDPNYIRVAMGKRGWASAVSAIPEPGSLLVWPSPQNFGRMELFASDLRACLDRSDTDFDSSEAAGAGHHGYDDLDHYSDLAGGDSS